jgi:hypothetical protein
VEGRDSILLGADHGVFTVGLRSGQMGKKVCERRNSFPIFPYMASAPQACSQTLTLRWVRYYVMI